MRELGVIAAIIDPAYLQGLGAFFGGIAAFGAFVAGILNRTRLKSFFEDRFLLVESANDARKRAEVAEKLAADYKGSVEAMRVTLDSFAHRLDRLEKIEKKFDSLCLWVIEIVKYVVFLERKALDAGADLGEETMPAIPSDLKDDVTIPKGVR